MKPRCVIWMLAWLMTGVAGGDAAADDAIADANANGQAAAQVAPDQDAEELAIRTLELFIAKCNECHGSHLRRPKEFGYIDDLAKLAADSMLIVPYDPDDSEVYLSLVFNSMPPASSDIPPLTEAQKQLVHDWIAAGAPAVSVAALEERAATNDQTQPATNESEAMPREEAGQAADDQVRRERTRWEWWRMYLGRFHPASTHFPIAFLVGAFIAELLYVTTTRLSLQIVVRFCLWLGTLGAIKAAALGWFNAEFAGYSGWHIEVHRWTAVATCVAAVLSLVCAEWRARREDRDTSMYLHICLFTTFLLVLATGFFGGALIYGLDHYNWW